jgi:hypothetical protein
MYSCKMTSNQDNPGNASLLDLTYSANAKLRTETAKLQGALDDQTAGIQALREHTARVENHARHSENLARHSENHARHIEVATKIKYESSFSWKITAPLRAPIRIIGRLLKSVKIKSRS